MNMRPSFDTIETSDILYQPIIERWDSNFVVGVEASHFNVLHCRAVHVIDIGLMLMGQRSLVKDLSNMLQEWEFEYIAHVFIDNIALQFATGEAAIAGNYTIRKSLDLTADCDPIPHIHAFFNEICKAKLGVCPGDMIKQE